MKMFTSLEDLNKFLTEELGLAPLPQEVVDQGIAAAVAQAGPDAEEAVATFSFNLTDGEQASPVETPDVVGYSEDDFNSYVEFSSEQIARISKERDVALSQRDEAVAAAQQEIKDHLECHEHMQLHIHQVRVQGYAEALAAGLFPGVPFERLEQQHQDTLMQNAQLNIARIDEIRAELNTPITAATKH